MKQLLHIYVAYLLFKLVCILLNNVFTIIQIIHVLVAYMHLGNA
jgi:hypothetical protein